MSASHPTLTPAPPAWARNARAAALVLAVAATFTACSASDDSAATSEAPAASSDESAPESTTDEGTTDEGAEEEPASGGYTSDDVGNATLHVNGVAFPDFTGDCEISRGNGKEDVGDLNDGDIVTIIGVDNVKAHEDMSMNYIALNEESFTFRDLVGAAGVGSSAKGEITTLTELSPRTADGSRDIVEVRFVGVLEDGTTLDADVVCELQNAF